MYCSRCGLSKNNKEKHVCASKKERYGMAIQFILKDIRQRQKKNRKVMESCGKKDIVANARNIMSYAALGGDIKNKKDAKWFRDMAIILAAQTMWFYDKKGDKK